MIDPDRKYSINGMKEYVGSRATIYREARAHRLRLTKLGRSTFAFGRDILAYQASLPTFNDDRR